MEISSAKYRVGMPPVRPLPLENTCDVADVCSPDVLDELYEKVADILRAHDIDLTSPLIVDYTERPISLVYRSYPKVPESARLTLLVVARWTNSPEAWELAVQAIRPLVLEYLPTQQEVDVEMIDEGHFASLIFSPVGDDPEVARIWGEISGEIEDVVQNNPASRGTLTLATVFLAGKTRSIMNPVIVFVGVSDDCAQADWPPIIADIKRIIEPHHLELTFEHCSWEDECFALFD